MTLSKDDGQFTETLRNLENLLGAQVRAGKTGAKIMTTSQTGTKITTTTCTGDPAVTDPVAKPVLSLVLLSLLFLGTSHSCCQN